MFPSYIIREQILKENAAFLKEKEDYQIRRDTLQLRLVCEDNIQFLYVHKRKTLAETTVRFYSLPALTLQQLAWETYRKTLPSFLFPIDCVRLRSYNLSNRTFGILGAIAINNSLQDPLILAKKAAH